MAKATDTKDDEVEVEAPAKPRIKPGKRKLIIFSLIGIVVLALAGGGAFFLLGGEKQPVSEGVEEEATEVEEGAAGELDTETLLAQAPTYVKLETFTTNLAPEPGASLADGEGQYIQIVVELKVENAPSAELLKQYTPEIRDNILRLLSTKQASKLASTEGRDVLANEIRNSVNGILNPVGKDGKPSTSPVASVLFSSFIIQ